MEAPHDRQILDMLGVVQASLLSERVGRMYTELGVNWDSVVVR